MAQLSLKSNNQTIKHYQQKNTQKLLQFPKKTLDPKVKFFQQIVNITKTKQTCTTIKR